MRLLLVEDERSLSKAVKTLLEKNNYSVDAVYNGKDALDYLSDGIYDGVILDVMMPGMSGFEVLQHLREGGNMVPVLILSAKTEVDDKVTGLDFGANDYLTKPFATKELLARIRAMTRTTVQQKDVSLRYGNVTLDCGTFRLEGPNEAYILTNKEFQIMQLLLREPDRIHVTERILEKVWGYDSDAEINLVWTYLSYLRKKLSAIGADIEIKAVRNAGYRLVKK